MEASAMLIHWHGLFLPPLKTTTDFPWPVDEIEKNGHEGVMFTLSVTRGIMLAKIKMKPIFAIIDEGDTGVRKLLKMVAIGLMQCHAGMIMLP